jgi:hypothetical protein
MGIIAQVKGNLYMRLLRWMLLFAMVSLITLNGHAQEVSSDSALLRLLGMIPAEMDGMEHSTIYFLDRAAIEQAYPDTSRITSWEELIALDDETTDIARVAWYRVFLNIGSAVLRDNFAQGSAIQAAVGFDALHVDRDIIYALPPAEVILLEGSFDENAVRDAFRAMNFIQNENETRGELWCGEAGCDAGQQVNMAMRNPANPFGGNFGRQQPLIIGDDTLISSAAFSQVDAALAAINGDVRTLADDGRYAAAVTAVDDQGVLLQAFILDGSDLLRLSQSVYGVGRAFTPDVIEQLNETEPLPQYSLLVMADAASDTDQIGVLALVYSSRDDANAAVEVIPARLEIMQSVVSRRSWSELLAERDLTVDTDIVEIDDYAVALIRLRTPIIPDAQTIIDVTTPSLTATDYPFTAPGIAYRLLLQAVTQADVAWLATAALE